MNLSNQVKTTSSIDFSNILLVLMVFAFLGVCFFYIKSKKQEANKPKKEKIRNLKDYIQQTNQYIMQYNNIQDRFNYAMEEKADEIRENHDKAAFDQFLKVQMDFRSQVDESALLLDQIKTTLQQGQMGLQLFINFKNSVTMMDALLVQMQNIVPSYHERKQENKWEDTPETTKTIGTDISFFIGCDTKEKIIKRYRALCKVYHPDSQTGNTEMFKKLKEAYEMEMGKF